MSCMSVDELSLRVYDYHNYTINPLYRNQMNRENLCRAFCLRHSLLGTRSEYVHGYYY